MRTRLLSLMLMVLLGSNGLAQAEDQARVVDPAAIDAWLLPLAEEGFLSGCLLVARGDVVLYERCFGEANVELDVPNSPDSRFAIASVTKALQNILLARLVDAGKLELDDQLSQWLPDFPRADEITLMQVATHRAGIPHRVTEPRDEIFSRTAADMVELVKEAGLAADPGGEYSYSSAGYSVLARVLEIAGEATWSELMQREVFAIAGLQDTVHPEGRRLIPNRANSYEWTPQGFRLTDPKDLSFLIGAGSLYSTPRDLFKILRTLVDGGYGPTAQEYLLEENDFGSNGLTNGYRAFIDYSAESDLSVVLCANVVTGALGRIRDELPLVFAGGEIPAPDLPDVAGMTASDQDYAVFEGSYELRPGRELGVRSAGSYLDVDGWMLLPLAADTFFCVQDFGKVVFERGPDNKVIGLHWGESRHHMPRVGEAD